MAKYHEAPRLAMLIRGCESSSKRLLLEHARVEDYAIWMKNMASALLIIAESSDASASELRALARETLRRIVDLEF